MAHKLVVHGAALAHATNALANHAWSLSADSKAVESALSHSNSAVHSARLARAVTDFTAQVTGCPGDIGDYVAALHEASATIAAAIDVTDGRLAAALGAR